MSYSDYYWQMSEGANEAVSQTSPWYRYLCEYYSVSLDEAIKLGTRSSGRRPSLPGSRTCKPVSGMTFEDIWAMRDRTTQKDIFQFYIDQGAWSTFRQTVRHSDRECKGVHNVVQQVAAIIDKKKNDEINVCEYGSGIAPYARVLLESGVINHKMNFYISDVDDSEHFLYSSWMLNRIVEDNGSNASINPVPIKHDSLPSYDKKMDLVVCFEVMEHVESPVASLNNLIDHMNPGCHYLENFIKHDYNDDDDPGPDLKSAKLEREKYYEILNEKFELTTNNPPSAHPNETRIWTKK
tara:strand:+ start:894 stop:1778 length:885 start_codon:yes stop_codon:yes gene_type:complete